MGWVFVLYPLFYFNTISSYFRLTPTPMVAVGQQKDQHYNRPPPPTAVPESVLQQPPHMPSAAVLAQQRRTPPIFPQPGQVGPPRPTTLFGRDVIPAIIELLDNGMHFIMDFYFAAYRFLFYLAEDDFLSAVLRDIQADRIQFKLAPAYVIYMCCRYRVSPHYRTGIRPEERNQRLAEFLTKVIGRMHVTIQVSFELFLALWNVNFMFDFLGSLSRSSAISILDG